MIPTPDELAELAHNEANKYSYEGEWGVRKKSRSDKAWMENFIRESWETRYIIFARAVRDAVLEGVAMEASDIDSYVLLRDGTTTTISKWLRSLKGPSE